ncbi:1,4-dihydroxy-2-naphthoate octaprenyltransferase [Flavobacterium sp. NST-5]|uniref:1,4-dihydroxy-2-naphthoate octaprenyltransferase n=1 Tax=Flavobacterium ichthyis TaxID=2698827 RepID=A0ABW9Z639_9FLAO|nr:1,4-dihydroxy-2-naphthoate octaprenyltransferase [Flavobacterium ichthyis]NBL64307.1 1,4-dihydroxy-2-naphthoate octaprenyltransferase [Flavobacterium ichthyis]
MRHWVEAARLRTLPLSVSGIIVGSMFALAYPTQNVLTPTDVFNWQLFGFALLTTLGLQILSNFANDYGDGVKGTDNDDRIGPKRALQSGTISAKSMKRAIIITSFLTFICSLLLIYFAFGVEYIGYSVFFIVLGTLAIMSAIRYTVGNTAYGYRGYGDFFVFVFFGLVSTLGVNFLYSKEVDPVLILPAFAIGFLSVGVLNLNNMRDEISDRKVQKNTLVVKIGGAAAKKYHYFLVISAMVLCIVFSFLLDFRLDQYLFLIAYIPFTKHLFRVKKATNPKDFDPELKKLAIATFLLSILLSLDLISFIQDVVMQIFNFSTNQF